MAGFRWTDERVELLRKRVGEGATRGQIAREFSLLTTEGETVTRSTILCKAYRLGLRSETPEGRGRQEKHPRPPRPKQSFAPQMPRPAPKSVVSLPKPPQPVRVDPLPAGSIELHQLEPQHCCWPSGDSDFLFCGEPRVERDIGGMPCPYCEAHARMAYDSATTRTARQRTGDEKRSRTMRGRLAA